VVREADQVRYRIGLAGQHAAVDEKLAGRENLRMFGRLYHLPERLARQRADELLEKFGLTDAANRVVKTYSGGMRRRLDIAASLIVAPPVLFLDEPTTGLDPRSRGEVWRSIRELVEAGTTVLLSTQYLDEADRLADQIVVIDCGRRRGARADDTAQVRPQLGWRRDGPLHAPGDRGLGGAARLPGHHDFQQFRANGWHADVAPGDRGLESGQRARRRLSPAVRKPRSRHHAPQLAIAAPRHGDGRMVTAAARRVRAAGHLALPERQSLNTGSRAGQPAWSARLARQRASLMR